MIRASSTARIFFIEETLLLFNFRRQAVRERRRPPSDSIIIDNGVKIEWKFLLKTIKKIIKNKLRALIIWMNLCKIRITMI